LNSNFTCGGYHKDKVTLPPGPFIKKRLRMSRPINAMIPSARYLPFSTSEILIATYFLFRLPSYRWLGVTASRIPPARKKPLVSAPRSPALLETCPAVDRSALRWLERNFRLLSTIGACRLVHLAPEALSICHFQFSSFFLGYKLKGQLDVSFEGPRKARCIPPT